MVKATPEQHKSWNRPQELAKLREIQKWERDFQRMIKKRTKPKKKKK